MTLTRSLLFLALSALTVSISHAKQPHTLVASSTDAISGDTQSFAELNEEIRRNNIERVRGIYEGKISKGAPVFRNHAGLFIAFLKEQGIDANQVFADQKRLKQFCWSGFADACLAASNRHSPEIAACAHGPESACQIDPQILREMQRENREMAILACLQGHAFGCQEMTVEGDEQSRLTAIAQMEQFCREGNPAYCSRIPMLTSDFGEKAVPHYEKGCREGDVYGCAELLESPASAEAKDFARDALRADCDSKDESPTDIWDHQQACSAMIKDASKNGNVDDVYAQARSTCLDGNRFTCLTTAIEMAKNHKREEVYEMVKEYCRGFGPYEPDHGLNAADCAAISSSSQATDDVWEIVQKAHASPGAGGSTTFGDYFRAPAGTSPPSKGYELPPLPPILYK